MIELQNTIGQNLVSDDPAAAVRQVGWFAAIEDQPADNTGVTFGQMLDDYAATGEIASALGFWVERADRQISDEEEDDDGEGRAQEWWPPAVASLNTTVQFELTGAELRVTRARLGFSPEDAHSFLHVGHKTYRTWERGDAPIPRVVAEAVTSFADHTALLAMFQARLLRRAAVTLHAYRKQEDFAAALPHLAAWLPVSWHRTLVGRVASMAGTRIDWA